MPTTAPELPSAPDPSPDGSVTIPPSIGWSSFAFEASGFAPNELVFAAFYSEPVFAGWFRADAAGVVSGELTLPSGLAPGAHTLQLTGAESGWVAAVGFELEAMAPTGGSIPAAAIILGLLSVTVGAALIVRSRRRQRV